MIDKGDFSFLKNSRVLITGGTGSLGKTLVHLLIEAGASRVVVFSRDEFKQSLMQQDLKDHKDSVRFFLGNVRDPGRLSRALHGIDFVIHTAALKQVPAAEYNPFEFIKTNVLGAQNIISASIDAGVKKVVALSTDKAANPINLYGATKLCSDKLFVAGNSYSGDTATRFSVVRYGNVVGSRGSVVPFFLTRRNEGTIPITDDRMTRFWITLEQAAHFVLNCMRDMHGGELWIPKIPSMRITDIATTIAPECKQVVTGIRPGEKLHEVMVPIDDSRNTVEFEKHFVIKPTFPWWDSSWHMDGKGTPCPDNFYYGSDNNTDWLDQKSLRTMIASLKIPEAQEWAKGNGLA